MTAAPKPDWPALCRLAGEILKLKPWEDCAEDELFAIQPQAGGTVYFASVMGSMGEHFAVAFYPGLESLMHFRQSQCCTDDDIGTETILLNDHLQLTFEPKKSLQKQDLAIVRSGGKSYRQYWPAFRACRPARLPWPPNAVEAEKFRPLLEQFLVVLKRFRAGEGIFQPFDADEFFLRANSGDAWVDSTCRISDLPPTHHILSAEVRGESLQGLPRKRMRVEIVLTLMITPVFDVPKGEPPFLPFLLLVVDSKTGMVLGVNTLSTKDGVDAAMIRIPDALVEIFQKAGFVPDQLLANHPVLLSVLVPFGRVHGISWQQEDSLPAASAALQSLKSFMGG